jgi:hypothetical protein
VGADDVLAASAATFRDDNLAIITFVPREDEPAQADTAKADAA